MSEDGEPSAAQPVSEEVLRAQARTLSELAVDPAFVEIVEEIQNAAEEDRLDTAERLARLDTLTERGAELPEDLRLTTRYFEDPNALLTGSVQVDGVVERVHDVRASTQVTICISLGYIGCVTVGATEVQ